MDRQTRWKARLAPAIVAALLVATATPAHAATLAGDEYVLDIPGVRQADSAVNRVPDAPAGGGGGVQRGVVGETNEPAGPLAALGDALTAIPASILAGLAALLAVALLADPRRRLTPRGSR